MAELGAIETIDEPTDWCIPKYLQSNGKVERGVKTMKMILKKSTDEYVALLSYRSTSQWLRYSSAQLSLS